MIIGITGTLGAGKGTVAEYLKEKGFKYYSVRDFLIEEIKSRGLEVGRDSMVLVANDLRENKGVGYIVEELCERALSEGGDVAIESIRCPGEVEALRGKDGFVLWAIDADVESRYSRLVSKGDDFGRVSFDRFLIEEGKQMYSNDPNKQNLKKCIEMADHVFKNDWTIADLKRKVDGVLEQIGGRDDRDEELVSSSCGGRDGGRPDWNCYFMEIAVFVGRRSSCDLSPNGCVIVKDNQILSTGYVGSASGLVRCDEVGHDIERIVYDDGSGEDRCSRIVHAEQNAICQAAKLGVSIRGSTLYCDVFPCIVCAKLIINSGIKKVIYRKDCDDKVCDLLEKAGVEVEELGEKIE